MRWYLSCYATKGLKVYRTPGLLKMCHYDFKIHCHWLQLIYCQLFYIVTVKLKKVITEISSSFYVILFDLSENYYCKIMGSIFIWSVYGKENLIQFQILHIPTMPVNHLQWKLRVPFTNFNLFWITNYISVGLYSNGIVNADKNDYIKMHIPESSWSNKDSNISVTKSTD